MRNINELYEQTVDLLTECFFAVREESMRDLISWISPFYERGPPADMADYMMWRQTAESGPEKSAVRIAAEFVERFGKEFGFDFSGSLAWLRGYRAGSGSKKGALTKAHVRSLRLIWDCGAAVFENGPGDVLSAISPFYTDGEVPRDPELYEIWRRTLEGCREDGITEATAKVLSAAAERGYALSETLGLLKGHIGSGNGKRTDAAYDERYRKTPELLYRCASAAGSTWLIKLAGSLSPFCTDRTPADIDTYKVWKQTAESGPEKSAARIAAEFAAKVCTDPDSRFARTAGTEEIEKISAYLLLHERDGEKNGD